MTHQWVSAKPREDYADIVAFAKVFMAEVKTDTAVAEWRVLGRGNSSDRSLNCYQVIRKELI